MRHGVASADWCLGLHAATSYLAARSYVYRAGYASECQGSNRLDVAEMTETEFLREAAWVVLSSGMREAVVRSRFNGISAAFRWWRSAEEIARNAADCRSAALAYFAHPRKMDAIATIAARVADVGFASFRERLILDPIAVLETLPYLGPATARHLAKNIGFDLAKPDRHLTRLASAAGFQSPIGMCDVIAAFTGESVATVDSVLWRYATLVPNYLALFDDVNLETQNASPGAFQSNLEEPGPAAVNPFRLRRSS
jgi:hypothetical protein